MWIPVVFGLWHDHVNGWREKKETYTNMHFMFYEDMVEVNRPGSACVRAHLYKGSLLPFSRNVLVIFTIVIIITFYYYYY